MAKDDDNRVLMNELIARYPEIAEKEQERLNSAEELKKALSRWDGQEEVRERLIAEKARIQAQYMELPQGALQEAICLMSLIGVEQLATMGGWHNDGRLTPSSNSMDVSFYEEDAHPELHDTHYFKRNLRSESTSLHFVTDLEGVKQVKQLTSSPPQPQQGVLRQYLWAQQDPVSYLRMIADAFATLEWYHRAPEPQRDLTFGTRGR